MLKIAHVHQMQSILHFPAEVIQTIKKAVTILDDAYGSD